MQAYSLSSKTAVAEIDNSIIVPIFEPVPSKKLVYQNPSGKFGQIQQSMVDRREPIFDRIDTINQRVCKDSNQEGKSISNKLDLILQSQHQLVTSLVQQNKMMMSQVYDLQLQLKELE